jgi:hypothetical protein
MSFTDGKPWIATEQDCNTTRWSGGKPGQHFRCYMCGHKFEPGERVRWQYTSDTPNAGGNPLLCETCDTPDVIERWKAKHAEWRAIRTDPRWWFFRKHSV